ncbi:Voltage-dependent calcium channel subunit alpha-2/delta-4 [Dissostichus eleginoides]|uniref:Voltage-dependent calcium channel subunit alpha-2/delta-4 n=1 Tax=Dissostichus eleginoides TaxID=100907 RepID=A0AAD9FI59_DISEL|nr:Voltage-dependent calcium channel subunit alpha-2/delta-4 [Dissostichus eleginoides]
MTLDVLESKFWAIAAQPNDTDCSDVDGVCPLRCDSVDIACYMIDNNGFVLISKQRNDAMCKMNSHSVSSAPVLWFGFSPQVVLSNFLLFLLEFNFCGFWHTEHFADAKASFSVSSAHKKRGDILQPCDTEYPSFVYEPSVKETNSIIKCGRCQK